MLRSDSLLHGFSATLESTTSLFRVDCILPIPYTITQLCTWPLNLSALVNSEFTSFWLRLATSRNAYLHSFFLPHPTRALTYSTGFNQYGIHVQTTSNLKFKFGINFISHTNSGPHLLSSCLPFSIQVFPHMLRKYFIYITFSQSLSSITYPTFRSIRHHSSIQLRLYTKTSSSLQLRGLITPSCGSPSLLEQLPKYLIEPTTTVVLFVSRNTLYNFVVPVCR